MPKINFTDSECETLANALRIAEEEFDKHAAEFAKTAAYIRAGNEFPLFASGEAGARGADRLEGQFKRQAKEVRELRDRIEEAEETLAEFER